MNKILTELLFKIKTNLSFKNEINSKVSKSSVGWHLDHALKVINTVSEKTIHSNPKDYKSSFNFKQWLILKLGFFPRGKAKAPKIVLPPKTILEAEIQQQLQTAKANIEKLEKCPVNAYFIHPLFGMLNKKQTLRFLQIHTNHHLKIVDDILNQ